MADEELAAGAVRVARAGHGKHALHVGAVIELGLDHVAGATSAGGAARADLGVRATALDHEALDDAVERGPIVEFLARQLQEVVDGAWRDVGPELDGHVAVVGVDDGTRGAGGGGGFHLFFVIAGGKGERGHDGHRREQAQAEGFHGVKPRPLARPRNPKPPLASPPPAGQGRSHMRVTVNDEPKETASRTLADLLAELGVAQEPAVAAAVDEQVVPRSRWSAHTLAEGARILVIRAAQGG